MLHKGRSAIKLINGGRFRSRRGFVGYLIDGETKCLVIPAGTEGTLPDYDCESFYLI